MISKTLHSSLFLCLYLFTCQLNAQVTSIGGRFEVDFATGCAPLTVNITPLDGLGAIVRNYDYNRDGIFVNDETHTFTAPGTYVILQLIQNEVPRDDSIVIVVSEPLEPQFNVTNCEGNNVKIEITDTNYDQYFIDFGDGSNLTVNKGQNIPPHNYPTQNSYTISIRGLFTGAMDNCGTAVQTINTINTMTAASINSLEVTSSDHLNGAIRLNYTIDTDVAYRIESTMNKAQDFEFLQLLSDPNSTLIEGLNTRDNYYCFRITAYDACTGITLDSDTICSIQFNAEALDNNNDIMWSTENLNFSSYELTKNGVALSFINNATISSLNDTDIICNMDYCYEIILRYTNGMISTSATSCVTAFTTTTPDPILDVTGTVDGTNIILNWEIPTNFTPDKYLIFKFNSDGSPILIDSVEDNSFIEANIRFDENPFCYKVNYRDQCGNFSAEGTMVCPVLLTVNHENNQAELTWTPYEGWQNGVNRYLLEIINEDGMLIESIPLGTGSDYIDNLLLREEQILTYRILAISNDGDSKSSYSNLVIIQSEVFIFLPNAFTPGNDGINDQFKAGGKYFKYFSMKIFNRWGQLLFSSDHKDIGWNGDFNGKQMPEGTYAYRIDVEDFLGKKTIKTGTVMLIRR